MMQIVSTKKNIAMVVYDFDNKIHFTPLAKYNPRCIDARAPVFNGSFDECAKFIHEVI